MIDSPPDPQASRTPSADERSEHAGGAPTPGGGRLEVSGTQVAASVLASVSAAVVASFFGVAGTVIGAAVVSVVATIGSAAYSLGIRRTQHRLHKLQALRATRPFPSMRAGGEVTPDADVEPDDDDPEPLLTGDSAVDGGWRGWLAERRWGLAAGVALVFVISLATVTLIELAGDRTLARNSSGSARTSIGALVFGDDDGADTEPDADTDADPDVDADSGGPDGGEPSTPPEDVPGDTTTTSAPGGTPSTTAPDLGGGNPAGATSTTSTTSTTAPTDPATATTTTVPEGQAAVPPAPPTAGPAPTG